MRVTDFGLKSGRIIGRIRLEDNFHGSRRPFRLNRRDRVLKQVVFAAKLFLPKMGFSFTPLLQPDGVLGALVAADHVHNVPGKRDFGLAARRSNLKDPPQVGVIGVSASKVGSLDHRLGFIKGRRERSIRLDEDGRRSTGVYSYKTFINLSQKRSCLYSYPIQAKPRKLGIFPPCFDYFDNRKATNSSIVEFIGQFSDL